MDKTIGYREITVKNQGGETEIIPLKFGLLAIENYCVAIGIDFDNVVSGTLEQIKKRPITVYANILLAGAQCYQMLEGDAKAEGYTPKQAFGWVDQIGIYSDEIVETFHEFLKSVLPPDTEELNREPDEFDRAKKKKSSRSKK